MADTIPHVAPPITLIEDERGIVTSCCAARVEVTRVVRDLVSYSPHSLDRYDREDLGETPTLMVKYDRVDSGLDSDGFVVRCQGCGHRVSVEVEEA